MKLAVLIVAVAASRIHVKAACNYPSMFEGYMSTERVSFFEGVEPTSTREESRFGYDNVNQRSFQHQSLTANNKTEFVVSMTFARLNVTYTIKNGTCTKSPSGHWVVLGVPNEAVYVGTYYVGQGRGSLITNYRLPGGPGLNASIHMAVASDCVPVSMSEVVLFGKGGFSSHVTFENISLGIADDCVFKVPEVCLQASQAEQLSDSALHYNVQF